VFKFSVIQQPAGQPVPATADVVWQTCVRQIAFVEDGPVSAGHGSVWHDDDAYVYLLEIVCGLHSPMLGETEVLHQFKVFADRLGTSRPMWRELSQAVIADARVIRARHLIGLGSRSYGSAVRRHVRGCARVALLGTGMLAREILPFLDARTHSVDLWGRRDQCPISDAGAVYRSIHELPRVRIADECGIVVAAPVPSATIADVAACYGDVAAIVDLRAEGRQDPPPPIAPVVTLDEVFAGVQDAMRAGEARIGAARSDIRECARAFASRAKLNPSGWHDLCA
jgi:glutamyl-tRNA reductase